MSLSLRHHSVGREAGALATLAHTGTSRLPPRPRTVKACPQTEYSLLVWRTQSVLAKVWASGEPEAVRYGGAGVVRGEKPKRGTIW